MIYLQVRNEIKLRFVDYCSSVKVYRKILWYFILQNNNEVSTMGLTYQSLLSIPNSMAIQRSKATGSKINIEVKISAQPHTTLCIQFLDRENNDKKQYIAIGKTDLFYNSMGLCGNFTRFSCSISCLPLFRVGYETSHQQSSDYRASILTS